MTDRKKPGAEFWATVVVMAILALYIGAYALLCRPYRVVIFTADPSGSAYISFTDEPVRDAGYCEPNYAAGTELQARLRDTFLPIHELDRIIRPSVWGRRVLVHPEPEIRPEAVNEW